MSELVPPSFDALLAQLRAAHELELQQLKRENDALRGAQVGTTSGWHDDCFSQPDHTESEYHTQVRRDSLGRRESLSSQTNFAELARNDGVGSAPTAGQYPSLREEVQAVDCSRGTWWGPSRQMVRGSSLSVFGDIEPRALDFKVLSMEFYPGRAWDDLTVHEKVTLLRSALKPRHWMVNPHCNLMRCWDGVHALALAFVGTATPYEVVFLSSMQAVLFAANRLVDVIFFLDIILQFFLQVEVQRPHRGGSFMVRDPRTLRIMYLKSWFLLDVVSVFPFDVLSLMMASSSPFWQRAKILRCLKLMRLAKLVRMLRASAVQQRWKDASGLRFGTQRLIKFCVVLMLVSHWMACVWGFIGLSLGAELCSSDGQPLGYGDAGVGVSQVSWVTTLYLGGKISPDNPCNNFEVYIAALHWAVMTLTSIGYGDIVPVRLGEYIGCILCMIVGGVLWAYVIGCVCSIISNASPVERNYELKTDMLNVAMEEAQVPQNQRQKYREYLREAKAYERRISFGRVAGSFSPLLRKQLMYQVSKDALRSVYYFQEGTADTPSSFLLDTASCLIPRFFSPLEGLDSLRFCLCMMDRGTVAHCGRILVHPSVFHEDFIISKKKYQKVTRTVSLTYTQVLVLTRRDIIYVLESRPWLARKIWRCALKAAFCRAVHMTMVEYKKWKQTMPGVKLTLSEAFDVCCGGKGSTPRAGATRPPSPTMYEQL